MVKRRSLSFDSDQLTKDLKESAGKGVNALFSPTSAVPPPDKIEKGRPEGPFAKLADSPTGLEESPTAKIKKKSGTQNARAYMHARKHASMHTYIHAVLDKKATNSFAFRYPPELLETLEDILHRIWRRYKVKVTKNSVAVTAMAFLLWDFQTHGKDSILYEKLVKRTE